MWVFGLFLLPFLLVFIAFVLGFLSAAMISQIFLKPLVSIHDFFDKMRKPWGSILASFSLFGIIITMLNLVLYFKI